MWFDKGVERVRAREWKSWVEANDAVVVDVREPHEWAQGTLDGAMEIRLTDLPGALSRLDPHRATLVICRSGNRSGRAAKFLAGNGFQTVGNLSGGLRALGLAR